MLELLTLRTTSRRRPVQRVAPRHHFWRVACTLAAVTMLAVLASGWGVAQAQTPDIGAMTSATGSGDKSVEILSGALGEFFLNPLAGLGGATTLLGSMFVIFNGFIFMVCVLWGGWGITRGIVSTAHEGQVLGQKLSAVWMPIRMVTGIAGVVPVFGGFSAGQAAVVFCTTLGIGLANLMWTGAVNATGQFQAMVSPAVGSSTTGASFREAAMGIMAAQVCKIAKETEEAISDAAGGATLENDRIKQIPVPGSLAAVKFGTANSPELCGHVVLIAHADTTRSGDSVTGFRVASVDYGAISAAVQQAYAANIGSFSNDVAQLANQWMAQRAQMLRNGGAVPEMPIEQVEQRARMFATTIHVAADAAVQGQGTSSITAAAKDEMLHEGWASAGAWFATFAEVNAALGDAVRSVEIKVAMPVVRGESGAVADAMAALSKGITAASTVATQPSAEDGGFSFVKNYLAKSLGDEMPTGDWSLGQAMVKRAIGTVAGDGQVNPIIMMKNLGDYTMMAGQAIFAATGVMKALQDDDAEEEDGGRGVAGTIASKIPGVGTIMKLASGAIAALISLLPMLATIMIGAGAMMAIYIPMLPFITWMGALVQYCVVVVEGLIAAPIAALAHMESEGEGMGPRTERGYIFILNVLLRPGLMLFGFFLASALMILLGTYQTKLFIYAMANAQGNSLTGLISIVAYLLIFLVLNWTLIQGLFNMIYLVPDQVLGYIGQGHTSELGREVEGKVHALFGNFTRTAGQASSAMAGPAARGAQAVATAGGAEGMPGSGGPGASGGGRGRR